MVDEKPFENVVRDGGRFRLPRRKWRELVFVGSLAVDGDCFVRDPSRPIAEFRDPDLFPEGVRFRVEPDGEDFVWVERV